ncbi:MAG: hypothetical protein AB7L66_08620 [Gemmatimonadales bacterium]
MAHRLFSRSVVLKLVVVLCFPRGASAQAWPGESRTQAWMVGVADLAGLQSPTRSPAMVGADLLLLHRLGLQWDGGVKLNGVQRKARGPDGKFASSTWGLYVEMRRRLGDRRVAPYLIATSGLANTRVDYEAQVDQLTFPAGTDATTAVFGGGVGLRFTVFRSSAFIDVQYLGRTTPTHGSVAFPVRLGLNVNH